MHKFCIRERIVAVQQNRSTRSKRGMRRAHHALRSAVISIDKVSGEIHRRHHITVDGIYCGRKVIEK